MEISILIFFFTRKRISDDNYPPCRNKWLIITMETRHLTAGTSPEIIPGCSPIHGNFNSTKFNSCSHQCFTDETLDQSEL